MGLDIYLYERAQHDQNERHKVESDALWSRTESGQITGAEYGEQRKAIAQYTHMTNVPSEAYPDHLFNRRYLRSSYNDGGFNRAVPDFLGLTDEGDLYWMFAPMGRQWDGDEGIFTADDLPKFAEVKARALDIADRLRKCDPLRVEAVRGPYLGPADHMWSELPTEADVLAWFREEHEQNGARGNEDGGYSNAKGTVFGFKTGLDVLAVTVCRDVLRSPAPAIVYRSKALDSYVQSAEIVAEFCDEACALIERDGSVYMSWSG